MALISKHGSLFARCKYENTTVLRRLISELDVSLPDLNGMLAFHESYVFAEVLTKYLVLHDDKFISLDNTRDIDEKYIKQILDMQFVVLADSNQSHITNIGNHHVYTLTDVRKFYMLIPFKQDKNVFNVYVRTEHMFSFLLLKSFTVMASTRKVTNETHRLKQYKMDYLMNTLKVLNHTITNDTSFYRQIGCAIVFDCIPIIKRKTSLLYEPTALGHNVTLLHRLVNELTITALSYVLKVYLSKWEYFEGYPVFNYCSYKLRINVDYGDADTDFLFQYCQYRLAHESDRHNSNNRIIRNSNQEMVIKNTYSVSNAYAIYVKNDALFGVNDWIVLQRIDIDFGAYTNLLVANLQLTDHLVTFKQKHDGKHGEYDLVTTNAKHRIYARSDLPTIRANVSLHTFHWYFEVHIIKKELGENVWIGFANSDFEPNDKRRIGVGCDVNSWASNGSTALHENNKMRTWRTEWVEGDVVGVCIDLKGTLDAEDRKFIKYYLNGHLIKDIKFTKLRKCDGVYPCISLDKGTAIDIVFDPVYFAQTMPSKF
eukprot:174109_1